MTAPDDAATNAPGSEAESEPVTDPEADPGHPPLPRSSPADPWPPPPRVNGMAVASLVLGILFVYGIGSILALIFGYVARRQIRERREPGRGLATAGIVLGWIWVIFLSFGLITVALTGV